MVTHEKLDEIDRQILHYLFKDARSSFADIAKSCQVSVPAIAQRYKKMKKDGVIVGTTLIINTEDSQSERSFSIDIKTEASFEASIAKFIRELPGVLNCNRVVGKYDVHAGIRASSLEEIDQIRNVIKSQKGILSIEITPSIETLFFCPENLLRTSMEDAKKWMS